MRASAQQRFVKRTACLCLTRDLATATAGEERKHLNEQLLSATRRNDDLEKYNEDIIASHRAEFRTARDRAEMLELAIDYISAICLLRVQLSRRY